MTPPTLYIEGPAFWAPTLPGWEAARAAFRGEGALFNHHQFARCFDQSFGEGKTQGKVLQILWRHQHHRVGFAVAQHGNRCFFRELVDDMLTPTITPACHFDLGKWRRQARVRVHLSG